MPNDYVDNNNNSNEKLIMTQKQCARDLMSAISKLPWTKDSVVAGGAPRDWFMGKPATDIDIFLIDTTIGQSQLIHYMKQAGFGELKRAARIHCADRDPNNEVTYYTNPMIKVVYDGCISFRPSIYDRFYLVKFQIVVTYCKSIDELLATFPVEISKFTWDHLTDRIVGEPGALLDVQNKTLTQTYHDVTQGRYINKIKSKFPDYQFVNKAVDAKKKVYFPPSPTENQVKTAFEDLQVKEHAKPTLMFRDFSKLTAEQVSAMINSGVEHIKPSKQLLDPTAFAYWLQGFFEMTGATSIDERQTQIIKDHLAQVFNKVTPDRDLQPTTAPALANDMICENFKDIVCDGISPFRGHARVIPPTAILPAKTLLSC